MSLQSSKNFMRRFLQTPGDEHGKRGSGDPRIRNVNPLHRNRHQLLLYTLGIKHNAKQYEGTFLNQSINRLIFSHHVHVRLYASKR